MRTDLSALGLERAMAQNQGIDDFKTHIPHSYMEPLGVT